MKHIAKILFLFLFTSAFFSCEDELDTLALTDYPPGFATISPGPNANILLGDFDITVVFVDGTPSPLSSGSVTLKNSLGDVLGSAAGSLSGTMDSLVIPGSEFDAANLPAATYTLELSVTDAKGQTNDRTTTFNIISSQYVSVENEMYLAGGYNGWGADTLHLVADYTWEINSITMDGGEWKLKNCADWCDKDWADPDCDGVVQETTGGGPNTNCGHSGLVTFRYNDQTGAYQVIPEITYESNIQSLYLMGTFNNFFGGEYGFTQVADYQWELGEILLSPGDQFRFAEFPDFMGKNFGDNDADGVADPFGANIEFNEVEAFYKVYFNDNTLEYRLELVRFPSIGIIGDATPGGWDEDTNLTDLGNGLFGIVIGLRDGLVKFRANDNWDTNWGSTDFPSGTGTQGGDNIPVTKGLYLVTFNPETGEYNFETTTIGLIGDATPTGWDSDTDMTTDVDDAAVQTLTITLTDGFAKFRADNDWVFNWGSADFPAGTGTPGGDNIPITAGTYNVTFNVNTGAYSFDQ